MRMCVCVCMCYSPSIYSSFSACFFYHLSISPVMYLNMCMFPHMYMCVGVVFVCVYIYIHTNDLDMYPAKTCDCGRKFNSLRGSRIHKARWCEERNSPAGECKSNDGPMNQVYPHSIHEPIADHQRPGDIFCKPRI